MKIYTKTGDKGQTSLIGGTRVWKSDLRLDAYGTVDELNAFIGLLTTADLPAELIDFLTGIQHKLFSVGSSLATDLKKTTLKPASVIFEADILALEEAIDSMNANLPPIRQFILPGGNHNAATAHVCRAITRRAERKILQLLQHDTEIDPLLIQYINRLSDYFFVLSRYTTTNQGDKEIFWET